MGIRIFDKIKEFFKPVDLYEGITEEELKIHFDPHARPRRRKCLKTARRATMTRRMYKRRIGR